MPAANPGRAAGRGRRRAPHASAVTFACWPPGPPERENSATTAAAGRTSPRGVTRSSSFGFCGTGRAYAWRFRLPGNHGVDRRRRRDMQMHRSARLVTTAALVAVGLGLVGAACSGADDRSSSGDAAEAVPTAAESAPKAAQQVSVQPNEKKIRTGEVALTTGPTGSRPRPAAPCGWPRRSAARSASNGPPVASSRRPTSCCGCRPSGSATRSTDSRRSPPSGRAPRAPRT